MKYWEIIADRLSKPVEAWAGSQPLIPVGERSGLWTHTATTEAASLSMLMRSSARLITPQNRAYFRLLDDPKTPQQVGQVFLIGRVICLPLKALLWGERLVFTGLGV